MKQLHTYTKYVDDVGVSAKHVPMLIFDRPATLHHTLKNGMPQDFWYTVHHESFGYKEFDVRDWLHALGCGGIDISVMSSHAALNFIADLAEKVSGKGSGGHNDLIDFVASYTPNQRLSEHVPRNRPIDAVHDELIRLIKDMHNRSAQARATARKAYKAGNKAKWDKFNAVARECERTMSRVDKISYRLLDHCTRDRRDKYDIPF